MEKGRAIEAAPERPTDSKDGDRDAKEREYEGQGAGSGQRLGDRKKRERKTNRDVVEPQ